MPATNAMERLTSDYRRHNKTKRCACAEVCQALRVVMPRLAATEDGTRETAARVKQYKAGDYT